MWFSLKLNRTGSIWNRDERININDNWDILEGIGRQSNTMYNEYKNVLNEAKKTNQKNIDVQSQIDNLVLSKGQSDAEVIQARGSYDTLNSRLNIADERLDNSESVINVKTFGAKGDGKTDDYEAIQKAIDNAYENDKSVYLPSGRYYISKTLRTKHSRTYNYSYGIRIFGNGKDTVILGNNNRLPANYSQNLSNQALLAIHGSNNIIENLSFEGGEVGIYLGQDPTKEENSSVCFNILTNIWFEYNGTSIVLQHGSGVHYNKFRNVHAIHSQIGIHLAKGLKINKFNNNRNVFDGIRLSRMWLAIYIENGDGNMFNNAYTETINSSYAMGTKPTIINDKANGKATAIIAYGQYNVVNNYASEDVEWDLVNHGFRNMYNNLMIKDDVDAKITFETNPLNFQGNSRIQNGMKYQPTAGALYKGSSGTTLTHQIYDEGYNARLIDLTSLSQEISSKTHASTAFFKRIGLTSELAVLYRFSVAQEHLNNPIKIILPDSNDKLLAPPFSNALSGSYTFPIEVFYGTTEKMATKLRGRFSTKSERDSQGEEFILIFPPDNGWDQRSHANFMAFNLRYFKIWS